MSALRMHPAHANPSPARPAAEPRRFDRDATERAVAHFEQAQRFEADAWHAADSDPAQDADRWAQVAALARRSAEEVLIATILAHDSTRAVPRLDEALGVHQPGRGVRVGSRVYLAIPRPDTGPKEDLHGIPVMILVSIDADAIHGVSGAGGV